MTNRELQTSPACDHERRFGGINRLAGDAALQRLSGARVGVVGIGGVGSWAAEALARTGVGQLLLIDLDHVAMSNINRQIHALDTTVGAAKVDAMRQRIASYAPSCRVITRDAFVEPDTLQDLLDVPEWDGQGPEVLLDCCDQSSAKIAMALHARRQRLPFIMAGSAGGKWQAERLQCSDLSQTLQDPMLSKIRNRLRREHGFERDPKRRMQVTCVWSDEPVKRSSVCDPAAGLNCAGYGSLVSSTASMGFIMAGWAIRRLLGHPN